MASRGNIGEVSALIDNAAPATDVEADTVPDSRPQEAGDSSAAFHGKHVFRRVWYIVMISGIMNIFNALETNIFLPYLYTRVVCGAEDLSDAHYDITDGETVLSLQAEARLWDLIVPLTKGSELGRDVYIAANDVPHFPPHSKHWSMSSLCNSKAFVMDSAQSVQGRFSVSQKMATLVVLPVSGALADAAGRRSALLAYAFCCMLAASLFLFDSITHGAWGTWIVYLGGVLLCVAWEPKDSAINGANADVNGKDEARKGSAFTMIALANQLSWTFAFGAGFFIARANLDNYAIPWLLFTAVGLIILCLICCVFPETLPPGIRRPVSLAMLNPVYTQLQALKLFKRDPVLIMLSIMNFLWYISICYFTIGYSYLILIGFPMDEAFLPPLVGGLVAIPFSFVLVNLMPRLGVRRCHLLGHAMFMTAFFFWGPYSVVVGKSGPYFAEIAKSFGFAILFPANYTIISQRVGEENQSKCQALMSSIGCVAFLIGTPIYSSVLFDASAQGWWRAVPVFVSCALTFICVLLSLITFSCCAANSGTLEVVDAKRSID